MSAISPLFHTAVTVNIGLKITSSPLHKYLEILILAPWNDGTSDPRDTSEHFISRVLNFNFCELQILNPFDSLH